MYLKYDYSLSIFLEKRFQNPFLQLFDIHFRSKLKALFEKKSVPLMMSSLRDQGKVLTV